MRYIDPIPRMNTPVHDNHTSRSFSFCYRTRQTKATVFDVTFAFDVMFETDENTLRNRI